MNENIKIYRLKDIAIKLNLRGEMKKNESTGWLYSNVLRGADFKTFMR